MSAKHTPGPWVVKPAENEQGGFDIDSEYGYHIAETIGGLDDEEEANSRLIAAAPDLLAALQEMVEANDEPCRIDHKGFCQSHYLDHVDEGGCRVANAKAAIAKATGETE